MELDMVQGMDLDMADIADMLPTDSAMGTVLGMAMDLDMGDMGMVTGQDMVMVVPSTVNSNM